MILASTLVMLSVICASADGMTCGYDPLGRLISVTFSNGNSIQYAYDGVGNRTLLTQHDGVSGVPDPVNPMIADFDGNGTVDLADLAMLRGAFYADLSTPCRPDAADLNQDGTIDLDDFDFWYQCYSGSGRIRGDWTGREVVAPELVGVAAPDDHVDFWDLLLLAECWGRRTDLSQDVDACAIFGTEGASLTDLAALTQNWGRGRGPAGVLCVGEETNSWISEPEIPQGTNGLIARLSSNSTLADGVVYLDILLTGSAPDLSCFQFVLDGHLPLEQTLEAGAVKTGDPALRLDLPEDGTSFADVRRDERGWLITGAYLGGSPRSSGEDVLLCSVLIPVVRGERDVFIKDALIATNSGSCTSAAAWSGKVNSVPLPERITLFQNFPNPFNPRTTIEFAVPHRGQVTLRIYDVQGRLVRKVVDEILDPGWYKRQWDGKDASGRNASSGIYFLQLRGGAGSSSGKITLLR